MGLSHQLTKTKKNSSEHIHIPQFEPWLGEEELALVTETIRDNWITGGKKVKEFEAKIAELCEVEHAIACCNGTLALYMSLKALGIGQGCEVIVPDFTFIASANSVVMAGATPVFVDVDIDTFNISPEAIKGAITPRTRAIMPVHIYGQAADMDEIHDIAGEHGLYVVEDAAQGIGVKFMGKPVGGLGDMGCLSFYADKTITSGEGGMILTNSAELTEQCLILKHQGRTERGIYYHEHIGYNFRLTDLQAAVGLGQLSKLDSIIMKKKANEDLYENYLANVGGVRFPYVDPRGVNVPFRVNILVSNPGELSNHLKQEGVDTRRFFYPLHMQPCYRANYNQAQFPNSVKLYEEGLSLPSSVKLTQEQIAYVCNKIKGFCER